jgi:hypothetical protein
MSEPAAIPFYQFCHRLKEITDRLRAEAAELARYSPATPLSEKRAAREDRLATSAYNYLFLDYDHAGIMRYINWCQQHEVKWLDPDACEELFQWVIARTQDYWGTTIDRAMDIIEAEPIPEEWNAAEAIPSQPDGGSTPKDQLGDTAKGDTEQASKTSARRGRRKGKNYILSAIAELTCRAKSGGKLDTPSIAKTVGCSPQNLRKSAAFLSMQEEIRRYVAGEVTYGHRKTDGSIEAYEERKVIRNRGRHAVDPDDDD